LHKFLTVFPVDAILAYDFLRPLFVEEQSLVRPSWSEKHSLPKLVLASASPRRREILTAAGFEYDVAPTAIPERRERGESPSQFVSRLAKEKAGAACEILREHRTQQPLPIVGADTVVLIGRTVLGKPASPAEARRMLRLLSGRKHSVLTGVCLLYPTRPRIPSPLRWKRAVAVVTTTVKFRRLSEAEIRAYVATGEPLDKAGAYAIQGLASKYVERIEGCYWNVVGLPISTLYAMIRKMQRGTGRRPASSSR
jgi:septum formation protein